MVITHYQKLWHVWEQGQHILHARVHPLGLDCFAGSCSVQLDDTHNTLWQSLTDINWLAIQAQFLVLQMYGLEQMRAQWAKQLNLADGSYILAMSSHQLAKLQTTCLTGTVQPPTYSPNCDRTGHVCAPTGECL